MLDSHNLPKEQAYWAVHCEDGSVSYGLDGNHWKAFASSNKSNIKEVWIHFRSHAECVIPPDVHKDGVYFAMGEMAEIGVDGPSNSFFVWCVVDDNQVLGYWWKTPELIKSKVVNRPLNDGLVVRNDGQQNEQK